MGFNGQQFSTNVVLLVQANIESMRHHVEPGIWVRGFHSKPLPEYVLGKSKSQALPYRFYVKNGAILARGEMIWVSCSGRFRADWFVVVG